MIIIKPDLQVKEIFLAGPIQGAPDWQNEVAKRLYDKNVILYSPKRHDDQNFDYNEQVDWETEHLTNADIIVFYLAKEKDAIPGRSYAQTSRFELGENLARIKYTNAKQKVVIFCDKAFHGKTYIKEKAISELYKDFTFFFDNKDAFYAKLNQLI